MNENVIIKTPKRRRWIARLLVSALCILLASSLLFVSVVAENVNTFSSVQIDETDSADKTMYGLFYGDDGRYGLSELVYSSEGFKFNAYSYEYETEYHSPLFQCTYMPLTDVWTATVGWTFDLLNFASNKTFFWVYYHCYFAAGTIGNESYIDCIVADCFSWSGYKVDSVVYDSNGNETYTNIRNMSFMEPFCYFDLDGYAFSMGLYANGSDKYLIYENGNIHTVNEVYAYLMWDDGWFAVSQNTNDHVLDLEYFTFANASQGAVVTFGSTTYYHFSGSVLSYYRKILTNVTAKTLTLSDGVVSSANSIYPYNIDLARTFVYMTDPYSDGYYESIVGKGWYTVGFASARPTIKDAFKIYDIYATSSEYTPPDSSDETTTDPPPESSEESSGAVGEEYANIYMVEPYMENGYSPTWVGQIDLTDATSVTAYLGTYTLYGEAFQSDAAIPLTIRVYRGDEGAPDVYNFDFYAYGYGVGASLPSSFVFPDLVGLYVDIPFVPGQDLWFPTVAPYGSVFVSTPSVYGGRATINLSSADSYFRLDFVDADTFAVVVYNSDDGPPTRLNFNMDLRAYRNYFVDSNGDVSKSTWSQIPFGSSIKWTANDVLEKGLYGIFVDSLDESDFEGPWVPGGAWEDVASKNESNLLDISRQNALLESKVNDLYSKYPFENGMVLGGFDDAVSDFNEIKSSEGGSYILRYIFGMWTVHPFASSMIALVGTFALIGFIIREF